MAFLRSNKFIMAVSAVSLAVAVFDLGSDWWVFKDFCFFGGGKLTAPLGVFCIIATILFVMEVRNCVNSFRLHLRKERLNRDSEPKPVLPSEEKKLMRWEETVSFLLLALEDFPVTVIMYVTFRKGSCSLFVRIFEESFTGRIALLGAVISAIWKLIKSFFYCCSCKYPDIKGICNHIGCCCCRIFRPLLAICLIGFVSYLYDTFDNYGTSYRAECYNNDVSTPSDVFTTADLP